MSEEITLDDHRLVAMCRDGDQASFDDLVFRHQAAAYRFALKLLGDEEDAKEACIVAFGNAFRGLPKFNGRSSFKTWLFRILVNQCHSMRKQKARAASRLVSDEQLPANWEASDPHPRADPRQQAADSETEAAIREVVNDLPERLRVPWLLFATEEMSIAEIAEACGIAQGTVKSRLHHCRKQLSRKLAPYLDQEQPR